MTSTYVTQPSRPAPCPHWCVRTHADDDHPEDRGHNSATAEIPAVTAEPVLDQEQGLVYIAEATGLLLAAATHPGSTDTWIYLGEEETRGQHLRITTESAIRLCQALDGLLHTL